jgi:hypothetical protein
MDPKQNHISTTAAYWSGHNRLGDGDIVHVPSSPRRRGRMWRLLALLPGLLLIGIILASAIR